MKYPSTVSDQQVDIPVLLLINRGFHVDPSIYYYLIMFCFEKTAVIESIFVFNLKQYFMFLVSFLYFFRILKTFVCNTILDYKTILKIDVWGLRIKFCSQKSFLLVFIFISMLLPFDAKKHFGDIILR